MADRLFARAYEQLNEEMPQRQYGGNESARIVYNAQRSERYAELIEALKSEDVTLPGVEMVLSGDGNESANE